MYRVINYFLFSALVQLPLAHSKPDSLPQTKRVDYIPLAPDVFEELLGITDARDTPHNGSDFLEVGPDDNPLVYSISYLDIKRSYLRRTKNSLKRDKKYSRPHWRSMVDDVQNLWHYRKRYDAIIIKNFPWFIHEPLRGIFSSLNIPAHETVEFIYQILRSLNHSLKPRGRVYILSEFFKEQMGLSKGRFYQHIAIAKELGFRVKPTHFLTTQGRSQVIGGFQLTLEKNCEQPFSQ